MNISVDVLQSQNKAFLQCGILNHYLNVYSMFPNRYGVWKLAFVAQKLSINITLA